MSTDDYERGKADGIAEGIAQERAAVVADVREWHATAKHNEEWEASNTLRCLTEAIEAGEHSIAGGALAERDAKVREEASRRASEYIAQERAAVVAEMRRSSDQYHMASQSAGAAVRGDCQAAAEALAVVSNDIERGEHSTTGDVLAQRDATVQQAERERVLEIMTDWLRPGDYPGGGFGEELKKRDREQQAKALEDAAAAYSNTAPGSLAASTWLRERAAAIREGK